MIFYMAEGVANLNGLQAVFRLNFIWFYIRSDF